eukprot:2205499-Rhodomonas_salina.3
MGAETQNGPVTLKKLPRMDQMTQWFTNVKELVVSIQTAKICIVKLPLEALELLKCAQVSTPTFLLVLNHAVLFHSSGEEAIHNDREKLIRGATKSYRSLVGQQFWLWFLRHQRDVTFFPLGWEAS